MLILSRRRNFSFYRVISIYNPDCRVLLLSTGSFFQHKIDRVASTHDCQPSGAAAVAQASPLLFGNTARAVGDAPREIKFRHTGNCLMPDPTCGKGLADPWASRSAKSNHGMAFSTP
jgi:hypothetical protein